MSTFTLLAIGYFGACIGYGLWKLHLSVNNPEKYARLREFERQRDERQKKALQAMAKGAVGAAKGGIFLAKMLKK